MQSREPLDGKVPADEALHLDLVNQEVARDQLDEAAYALAARYAASTKAIGLRSCLTRLMQYLERDKMLDYEAHCHHIAGEPGD